MYLALYIQLCAKNKSFAFELAAAAALIMIYQMLDVEKYYVFLLEHYSE